MPKKCRNRNIFFDFGVALSVCTLMLFCVGCRSGQPEPNPVLRDVPVTPLHIGPYLLPWGSEPATTYGLATGVWEENKDSCGIFFPLLGTFFEGKNYGLALSPVCSFTGKSDFYGVATGILNPSQSLIRNISQNGIFFFPFETVSRTNGLSIEGVSLEKEFNGIDISLCCVYGGKRNGLQVVVCDCNARGDGSLNGCQIGWYLRSSVQGVQIGGITYNPSENEGTCFDLGVLNFDLKHGIQVGAFNRTKDGNPLQIGVFNLSSDGSPVQIGLLNYNPNGFLPLFPFVNFSTK